MSRSTRVLELVEAAQSLPREERTAWLARECAADDGLREEVEELLSLEREEDEDHERQVELLPGDAAVFIDRFKREVARATQHAEAHVRHQDLFDRLLVDLEERGARPERYRLEEPLGRGGMGEVYAAWDEVLRRRVAFKRLRTLDDGAPPPPGTQIRFLQEAQVTGQLDHPGVPTVYELGVQDGRLFFTMPLVRGLSMADLLRDLPEGTQAWDHRRALDTLLQAARTIAHAHDRGVVHRDLKPANLMTSRFGAAYVMDWGIARVVDEAQARELLVGADLPADTSESSGSGRAFETVAGGAMGTPSYMSPEQARAEGNVGSPADVYALGAILYELLAGEAPYLDIAGEAGGAPTATEVTQRAAEAPPTPLSQVAPDAPGELIAIAERAMQREPARRFPSVLDLVEDLENYLSGRVVQSYEAGLVPEVRKWVARNRLLAVMAALVVVTLVAGVAAVLVIQDQRKAEATQQLAKILRLSSIHDAERLVRELRSLWPDVGAQFGELTRWRDEALELADNLPTFEAEFAELTGRATRGPDGELTFDDAQDAWWHRQLEETITTLAAFVDRTSGPVFGTSKEYGPGIVARIGWVEDRRARLADPAFLAAWGEANTALSECGRYGDLVLTPDPVLLPLGLNPHSGLMEFAHLESGAPPERGEQGYWQVTPETGIVFVLVPGGSFWMGAQNADPTRPNLSRYAPAREGPIHEVHLEAYLIGAHELTTGQFQRLAGFEAGTFEESPGSRPVDFLNFWDANEVLERRGLVLPTESQWERAARGGTEACYYFGQATEDICEHELVLFRRLTERILERYRDKYGDEDPPIPSSPRPVDEGSANPFGLFNALGNLREWCRDAPAAYTTPAVGDEGLRAPDAPTGRERVTRGGNFEQSPYFARVTRREYVDVDLRSRRSGVRPARRLR